MFVKTWIDFNSMPEHLSVMPLCLPLRLGKSVLCVSLGVNAYITTVYTSYFFELDRHRKSWQQSFDSIPPTLIAQIHCVQLNFMELTVQIIEKKMWHTHIKKVVIHHKIFINFRFDKSHIAFYLVSIPFLATKPLAAAFIIASNCSD